MEYINKAVIQGRVGSVHIQEVSGSKVARISVYTEQTYRNSEGSPFVVADWHNVIAWNNTGVDVEKIRKGDMVHVSGRLRSTVYTSGEGIEHRMVEICASEIEIIGED